MYAARRDRSGFTLIELMVSVMIFALIMSLVYSMLMQTKETQSTEVDVTEARENARIALDIMQRDLVNMGLGLDRSDPEHPQQGLLYGDAWQIVFSADLDRDETEKLGPIRLSEGDLPALLYSTLGIGAPEVDYGEVGAGAETTRYSLDYLGLGHLTDADKEDNLFTVTRLDRTANPNDFYLVRDRFGSRLNGPAGENVHIGPEIVATNIRGSVANNYSAYTYPIRNVDREFVYPMFTYWGHFWASATETRPSSSAYAGSPLDLWGDLDHDGNLEYSEIRAIIVDSNGAKLWYAPEADPVAGMWDWDRNNNTIQDKTLDDVVKRVDITVTAEVGSRNVRYPNPRRSGTNAPYYYYDEVQKGSLAINLSLRQPSRPQLTVPTPTPTIPGTGTPPTLTPSPSPTLSPTASATPTQPGQILPPPKLAEVVIASYNELDGQDIVKAWAIDKNADKYSPPLVLLGSNPIPGDPVLNPTFTICGRVTSLNSGDLAKDNDPYMDLIVATSGDCAACTSPDTLQCRNLYLYHNEAFTAVRYGLQYNFQGAYYVRPPYLNPEDTSEIIQVNVGDVDHDLFDELILTFKVDSAWGYSVGRVHVYEIENTGAPDQDFRLLDTALEQFFLETADIYSVKMCNFSQEVGEMSAIKNDDIAILLEPPGFLGRQILYYPSVTLSSVRQWPYFPRWSGGLLGETINKMEIGDVWTTPYQFANHVDLIVGTRSNKIRVFRNLYNCNPSHPDGYAFAELNATEFGPVYAYPIRDIRSGDMFGAADHDDIVVMLDTGTTGLAPNIYTYEAAAGPTMTTRWTEYLPLQYAPELSPPHSMDFAYLYSVQYTCMVIGMTGILPSGFNAVLIVPRIRVIPTPGLPEPTPAYQQPADSPDWDTGPAVRVIRNSRGALRTFVMTQQQEGFPFPDDHVFGNKRGAQAGGWERQSESITAAGSRKQGR